MRLRVCICACAFVYDRCTTAWIAATTVHESFMCRSCSERVGQMNPDRETLIFQPTAGCDTRAGLMEWRRD